MKVSSVHNSLLNSKHCSLDLLRLDQLHPEISGNKWFKLKYNIEQALNENKKGLLSFGGAYSNHLHALAFAGKEFSLETVGIIRGEKVINDTLSDCERWGMKLHTITRSEYRQKYEPEFLHQLSDQFPGYLIIPEGGNNEAGIRGCAEILNHVALNRYDIIACAVGTGATFTGLLQSALPQQKLLGFTAVKNGGYLSEEIRKHTQQTNWELITEYHFGGFAKSDPGLLRFMQQLKADNDLQLDFIYTAKMMFGLFDLMKNGQLSNQRVLAIHTGGLQGNRSLI